MSALSRHFANFLVLPLLTGLIPQLAAAQGQGQGEMPPPAVTVVTLHAQDVPLTTTLPGRVAASAEAEVRPQVNGIVTQRLFEEGRHVTVGQPLFLIDKTTYEAAVAQAEAAVAQALAQSENARRDPERARQLLLHLSLFFRKNLKRQNDLATLQEEQEHCQSYLEIEQARFGERLTVINEIPPHLADVQLPSFTLQPLIENAIKHGTGSLLEQGRIRLFAEEDQDSVTLCVEDNAGAWPPGSQGDGLGMSIVDRRLRSAFGERFGIRVQCEPEQWTRVSFTLPRQPQSPAKEPT